MAASVVTGTVNKVTKVQNTFQIEGTLAVAAGDYATPGPTINIPGFTYPLGQGPPPISSAVPLSFEIFSGQTSAGAVDSLYMYVFLAGTTQANGKMQIFVGGAADQAPLDELDDGAMPAGVTGDIIKFVAVFAR